MKCIDAEKTFDLILDGEADDLQKTRFEKHLANCVSCRSDFENRQTVQNLFKNQSAILPNAAFDARMMHKFSYHQKIARQSWSNRLTVLIRSLSPSLRFAAWCGLLIFGLGTAFSLGRMSISSPAQIASSSNDFQSNTKNPATKEIIKFIETEPKFITKTEYKTRYVEVPIIKEKVVTKFIAQKKSKNLKAASGKENFGQTKIENLDEQKYIAEQFNLKNLQPVSNISYKIIKKGDTNE